MSVIPKGMAERLKAMAFQAVKDTQNGLSRFRIPPFFLSPLVRLLADNHKWKTIYIEAIYAPGASRPGYFECTCANCYMVRHTYIMGDPLPRYFEKYTTAVGDSFSVYEKEIHFSRCEEFKFRKILR